MVRLNVSSIGMTIFDNTPERIVGRLGALAKATMAFENSTVNKAEPKLDYRSPLGGWIGGQMAAFANVGLSPEKKRELGSRSVLVHA